MNNLINEEIHLPHGTKSVKIVTHVDLDGAISAISMINQLEKQGISKDRIVIEFAQYGDEKKDKNFQDRFKPNNNKQFVAVTDFAKLPKASPYTIFERLTGFKGNKNTLVYFLKSRNFKNMKKTEFDNLFKKTFVVEENKFTENSMKDMYNACVAYSCLKELKREPEITPSNIENIEYQLVTPAFLSDHHSNDTNALSAGIKGDLAAKSPSEAELIATKYAPGLWSKKDIEAVSMVDSANYTEEQLKNTIFLDKHFTGNNKEKNLAIIVCTIYDNMVKKDPVAAKWVLKNSGPNLVSFYSATLKAAKLNGKRLEYYQALKNGEIDKAKQLLADFPKELDKSYNRSETELKKVQVTDDYKTKNLKDLENAKTGYKTKKDEKDIENKKIAIDKLSAEVKQMKASKAPKDEIATKTEELKKMKEGLKTEKELISSKKGKLDSAANFTLFNGKDKKVQYSRFLTSLVHKDGQRTPFTLRYWDSFFQVAKNASYKGTVDFMDVQNHVLKDVEGFLKSKGVNSYTIKNVIKTMNKENGGHKNGIWSFQGFDQIKPTSKEIPGYWDARDKVKRADALGKSDLVPSARKTMDTLDSTVNAKYKDIKNECMEVAMKSCIKWTNQLYPPSKEDLEKLKTNDETFKIK